MPRLTTKQSGGGVMRVRYSHRSRTNNSNWREWLNRAWRLYWSCRLVRRRISRRDFDSTYEMIDAKNEGE